MQQQRLINKSSQLNMFRTIILPIFRSTRLCVTAYGAGHRPTTSWVLYTPSCNTQSSAPEDGQNNCPKHAELNGIINKPLLLHLVGCLYYLCQCCTVKQISDNEIYLLIKYIKSFPWRVAKRLSYIEEAQCLKVKGQTSKKIWTLQEDIRNLCRNVGHQLPSDAAANPTRTETSPTQVRKPKKSYSFKTMAVRYQ
jgi:hypothetical protein